MNKEKVRFGIIGVGRISVESFAPALQQSKNAELYAVASRDKERAVRLQPSKAYGDYDELIMDPDIDAVYIATHNGLHKDLTISALKSGKHVLCEKPLGCSTEDCEQMIHVASETGYLLMEAFMYRYHPQLEVAQQLIDEGRIGELNVVETSFRHHMTKKNDVRLVPNFGGGALLDVGCYCVNISRLFLGESPREVCAAASFDPIYEIDTSVQGALDYREGRWATISCGFESGLHQEVVLVGTEGKISLNEPFITWTGQPRLTLQVGRSEEIIEMERVNTFQREIEDFSDAILHGTEPFLRVADAAQNAEIVDRLRRAIVR